MAAAVRFQLREYLIADGELDAFVEEWRERVLPLRLSLGFSVLGPWVEREASRFVWIIGLDGDIEAANEVYYNAPERKAMDPDPARLIVDQRTIWLEAP